ncbi:uncharacterized protein LOC134819636 [Bolinopsis microptera]|uniref:uncharacterized protein LOC134819636 n=1 Tax=Bolinopsis microptera TaxID=2820187 RepID=UPI00307A3FB4
MRLIVPILTLSLVYALLGNTKWTPCSSRICKTDYTDKISAINFTLSYSTKFNFKIVWDLKYRTDTDGGWKHVTGLPLTFSKNSPLSFGCQPKIMKVDVHDGDNSDSIEVKLTKSPALFAYSLGSPWNFTHEVNLEECDPDIRFTGVVQKVKFYPLLRTDKIKFVGLLCEFKEKDFGTVCKFGPRGRTKVQSKLDLDLLKTNLNKYDQIRFSVMDGRKFVKMYILSIGENGETVSSLPGSCKDSENRALPNLVNGNYTISFNSDPNERTTTLSIEVVRRGPEKNSDSTNFTCDPVCELEDDNSCLKNKSYTVIVKILLRDVISDLKMETKERNCPEDMKWVEGRGCQCTTPLSYLNYTYCVPCTPGKLCSPLGRTRAYFQMVRNVHSIFYFHGIIKYFKS